MTERVYTCFILHTLSAQSAKRVLYVWGAGGCAGGCCFASGVRGEGWGRGGGGEGGLVGRVFLDVSTKPKMMQQTLDPVLFCTGRYSLNSAGSSSSE